MVQRRAGTTILLYSSSGTATSGARHATTLHYPLPFHPIASLAATSRRTAGAELDRLLSPTTT
eukprot:2845914-Pleurochrysis_carterae.AAC.1